MKLNWLWQIIAVVAALPLLFLLYEFAQPTPFFINPPGTAYWPASPSVTGGSFITILVLGLVAGWIIATWVRGRYGQPLEHGIERPVHKERRREEVLETLKSELAARDEQIAALEKRVRVLERIVTDSRSALAEEIERLRA